MSESNDEEKTEDPSQRKLDEAKRKGQVASSKEVSNFFSLFTFTMIVMAILPFLMNTVSNDFVKFIREPESIEISSATFLQLGIGIILDLLKVVLIPCVLLALSGIASAFMQNGFNISIEPIIPKLEKISPMKGFKRIFSKKSLMEFFKGLIKIGIVGIVSYYSVAKDLNKLNTVAYMDFSTVLAFLSDLAVSILIGSTIALFFMAILDFMYQKHDFKKNLMMTKQEVKEEYKTQEGDPHIKGKLKQIRMEKAKRRMMAAVPKADVIVTNPMHYAVALKYEKETTSAPMVVAMGIDDIALKIKEIAAEHKVPIVRNPTLARSLYAEGELDHEIPLAHYQAVAEIISYVYKLQGKRPS